jgi:hypothetical protein
MIHTRQRVVLASPVTAGNKLLLLLLLHIEEGEGIFSQISLPG